MSNVILQASRKYPDLPGVTDNPKSHTKILESVREAIQTHERRTPDVLSSFVRVQDLIDLGFVELEGSRVLVPVDFSSGGGSTSPLTTKGDLWGFSTLDARIPIGTNGYVLTSDSTQALGLKWAALPSGLASPLTTKGDVWGFSTVDARLPVGTNGQVITADSAQTLGIKWATPFSSPLTTKGDLHGFGSADARLAAGSNNQVLIADSAQTLGVKWGTLTSANVSYDPTGTSLTATNVQDAIDELEAGAASATLASLTDVNLSSIQEGDMLLWDGTDWVNIGPRSGFYTFDDFLYPNSTLVFFTTVATAGGSVTFGGGSAGHPGTVEITTGGLTATSNGFLRSNSASASTGPIGFYLGGGEIVFEGGFRLDSTWPASNTGQIRFGMVDEWTGAPSNGVHIQYDNTSANWNLYCRSGGSSSSSESGAIAVTTGWHHVKIVVNAAASSISAYIDGSLIGTVTTNIPTAALSWGGQIQKTAGSTAMTAGFDWLSVRQKFTSARA